MKRFIVLMVVIVVAVWAVRSSHTGRGRHEPARWANHYAHERYREHDDDADDREEARGVIGEVRDAVREAGREIRDAWKEVRHEVKDAYRDVRKSMSGDVPPVPPVPPAPAVPLEPPAPRRSIAARIVPQRDIAELGRSQKEPLDGDASAISSLEESAAIRVSGNAPVTGFEFIEPGSGSRDVSKVTGRISATEQRARADARRAVLVAVRDRLGPNVSSSWTPPDRLIDSMILSIRTEPVIKDYGTLYIADIEVDTSPKRFAALVNAYNRETLRHRLVALGGTLAFILTCLAAFTGYVRADEATKGYYTNRLRTLVAAGIGAAGVLIYQMVA